MTPALQLPRRFLYDRSQVHMDLRDWGAAIADMSASLELLPACASLHYSRGMAHYGMGNYTLAMKVGAQGVWCCPLPLALCPLISTVNT